MSRRNVLLVTIDQCRADALSCAGNAAIRTPHIDALARDGTLFTKHYANASPCGPSRAALFTGTYQHNNGVLRNGSPLAERFTNLALEARKAGYQPALFGYTDTAVDPRNRDPSDPDLHTYETVLPGFFPELHLPEVPLPWLADLERKGYCFGTDVKAVYAPSKSADSHGLTYPAARFRAEDSITTFLTDRLLDYISIRREDSWFAHAAYIRPHPPFIAPAPYHAMYRPEDMVAPRRAPTPAAEGATHPLTDYTLGRQRMESFVVGAAGSVTDLSDRDLAQLRATYFGMVSEVDDQIGRLMQQLKAWGLYDETLIILTSDHGEMLGDHWMLGKESYFKEAVHIPLVIRDPRTAPSSLGTVFEGFTEAVDIMPTVLEWIGLTVPRQCDGRSLLPICHAKQLFDWRREVHWELDFRNTWYFQAEEALGVAMDSCGLAVIRDDCYQYVHFAGLPGLFFDLESDPDCLVDRSSDPDLAVVMLVYAQRMLTWRMQTNARDLTGMLVGPPGVTSRLR